MTKLDLLCIFAPIGHVKDITIKVSTFDPATRHQSGYGFVDFVSKPEGALAALRAVSTLHNCTIDGIFFQVEASRNLLKQFDRMQRNETRRSKGENSSEKPVRSISSQKSSRQSPPKQQISSHSAMPSLSTHFTQNTPHFKSVSMIYPPRPPRLDTRHFYPTQQHQQPLQQQQYCQQQQQLHAHPVPAIPLAPTLSDSYLSSQYMRSGSSTNSMSSGPFSAADGLCLSPLTLSRNSSPDLGEFAGASIITDTDPFTTALQSHAALADGSQAHYFDNPIVMPTGQGQWNEWKPQEAYHDPLGYYNYPETSSLPFSSLLSHFPAISLK